MTGSSDAPVFCVSTTTVPPSATRISPQYSVWLKLKPASLELPGAAPLRITRSLTASFAVVARPMHSLTFARTE